MRGNEIMREAGRGGEARGEQNSALGFSARAREVEEVRKEASNTRYTSNRCN